MIDQSKLKIITKLLGSERVKLDENLLYFTNSKLDKKAEAFYIVTTQKELVEVLDLCSEIKLPFLILGNGTKIDFPNNFEGLVIKNRTSNIKISGIKGKVSKDGLGIEEALVEADSGVSISKLNTYLDEQGLSRLKFVSTEEGTLGGTIFYDMVLSSQTHKIKIWSKGFISEIDIIDLKSSGNAVLSLILNMKAKQKDD